MKVFLAVVQLHLICFLYGQECNSTYGILPDLERRARNYVVDKNEPFVIDENLENKWYDVRNNNMPTNATSVTLGICGTYFPIWMKGTIPEETDGIVVNTACIISYFDDCAVEKTVEVRNCGTRMIYKLEPTTQTSAYCFDALSEVPVLEEAPVFLPESATVKSHIFYKDVYASGGQAIKIPKFAFSCDFIQSPTETLFYKIIWFVNEAPFKSVGPLPYTQISETNLGEDELVNRGHKLNTNIQCGVRASKDPSGFLGKMRTSTIFWLGIKIMLQIIPDGDFSRFERKKDKDSGNYRSTHYIYPIKILNPNIVMKQGTAGVIQLQSTISFACGDLANINDPNCKLKIQMRDKNDQYDCTGTSIAVRNSDTCGTKLEGSSYREVEESIFYNNIVNMTITTKDINDFNLNRNVFVLSLFTEKGSSANIIMDNNFIGDVTVQVEAENAWHWKNCYSHLDPHMGTFDQRYYENQNVPGEFILYRHKKYGQEVQMKTYICYSWAEYSITCACAVSVRAGADLFVIDVCRSPVLIKHVSCHEYLIDVRNIYNYRYEIYMPLGTMIVVYIANWPSDFSSLSIDIMPSVMDVGQTEGLCGVLNDDPSDDFTMPSGGIAENELEFRDSWRIDYSDSFLNPLNHNPAYWNDTFYLCVCPTPNISSTTEALCSSSVFRNCTKKEALTGSPYRFCNIISKRSESSHSKEIRRILNKRNRNVKDYFVEHKIEKRAKATYTMEEAKDTCEAIFNRSCVAVKFESIANSTASREGALHDCTLDLNATADVQLVNIHCSSYSDVSERYIRRDSVTRMTYSQEVEEFYASVCINNCNGRGKCISGTCICQDPYIEKDCSLSKADPPAVLDTYNEGICSRNTEECCGVIPIYGNRFVEGLTKQKLQIFEVFSNGTLEILETYVTDLQSLNAFEADIVVPCDSRKTRSVDLHPDNHNVTLAFGVRVSLSNDGTNYGLEQAYYIYDAECLGYHNTTDGYTFYALDGKCYINELCYSLGEKDQSDSCKECRPATDPYSFSECTSTENSQSSQVTVIIASAVGGLGFIILVTLIVIGSRACLKKKTRICGSSRYETEVHTPKSKSYVNTSHFVGAERM